VVVEFTKQGRIYHGGHREHKDLMKLLRVSVMPEIRSHDLRHTAASLMLNLGIPVIIVSRRLGHSRPSITLDIYGHLMPAMQEEVANDG
jgi:integrase